MAITIEAAEMAMDNDFIDGCVACALRRIHFVQYMYIYSACTGRIFGAHFIRYSAPNSNSDSIISID